MWFLEKTEEQKQENIGITALRYIRSNECIGNLAEVPANLYEAQQSVQTTIKRLLSIFIL